MSSSSKKPESASPANPLGNAFAGLAGLRDSLPSAPTVAAKPVPAAKPGPARAVVRYERKGRGGKEATVIEQLGLPSRELDKWCSELKRALGCGGLVDDDTIVLQGDLRKRLEPLLLARGVRKVTLSG